MDVEKQIEFWRNGSAEDLEVAGELLSKGRYRHALFFAEIARDG
jgi:HEPN domain-containing protein